jgi:heat shock protein HslJ
MKPAVASYACVAVIALGLSGVAAAEERPLVCFGNEPSWSVDLADATVARLSFPGEEALPFKGKAVRHGFLHETLWRGSRSGSGDLVVWLQDSTCTDNMSGTKLPVTARVSTPDGRFLSGCCRVAGADAAGATSAPLDGTVWRLEELPGVTAAELAGVTRPVTLRFESGQMSGFSGCNRFSGGYELKADQLVVGPLATTQMACPGPGSSVERAFHAALQGSMAFALQGDDLKVTSASGTTLRFKKEPPPQLAGVDWKVTSFNNDRHAVVGVIGDSKLTMTFKDGKVAGSAGCNNFHGAYSTDGNRVSIGPLATTRRACEESLMTQEKQFLAALTSAVTWSIEGNVLDMHRADGERAIWAVSK